MSHTPLPSWCIEEYWWESAGLVSSKAKQLGTWWHTLLISAFRRLRQDELTFKAILECIARQPTHSSQRQNNFLWWSTFQVQGAVHYACGYVTVQATLLDLSQCCLCFAVWEGGSVWDLPLDTTTPGPSLEQLQQLEKAKAAKVWNLLFTSVYLPAVGCKALFVSFFSYSCLVSF